MKRALPLTISFLLILLALSPIKANAADWTMTEDAGVHVKMGMNGVSPHVERLNGVDRVWRSDGPTGTVASDCNDEGVCTNVPSRESWEMTLPLLHFQTAPSVLTLKILMGHPNRFIPLLVMMQDARVWELERQQLLI